MKKRQGFVSNSSSSSFIVKRNVITDDQYNKLINHMSESDKYGYGEDDQWIIKDHGEFIIGSTYMDNFDIEEFCFDINIPVRFFGDEYAAEYYVNNLTGDDDEN